MQWASFAAIGDALAYLQRTYLAPNRTLHEVLSLLERCVANGVTCAKPYRPMLFLNLSWQSVVWYVFVVLLYIRYRCGIPHNMK